VETTQSDLDLLNKAESKAQHKADISKGIRNPQVQRAVSSLRLVNPFKGY
jgi:response regulator of citrate/malate metabolism